MRRMDVEPLTKAAFASFGEVVETDGAEQFVINQGFAKRVNDLAKVDVAAHGGLVNISIFSARARPLPIAIKMMERHPLGSQLFFPLQDSTWLVVVCADPRDPSSYCAFCATGWQGVNYAKSVWHHPLLVMRDEERFIVVDRAGPGDNLDEVWLDTEQTLHLAP